jgi:hypothetical protein
MVVIVKVNMAKGLFGSPESYQSACQIISLIADSGLNQNSQELEAEGCLVALQFQVLCDFLCDLDSLLPTSYSTTSILATHTHYFKLIFDTTSITCHYTYKLCPLKPRKIYPTL